MKICTIVGARPHFIKSATLSRFLRETHQEVLIHTGQHYDYNMSEIFFEELAIPNPDYNLGISGGSHGKMTGKMLILIEEVLQKETPDLVLIYGDTNSTLAGALAAAKLHIPICHIEAGVRTGLSQNPEEINRILSDRISNLLMCCTDIDVENLAREGIKDGVYLTGDLMYDAALYYTKKYSGLRSGDLVDFSETDIELPDKYYLLTSHREENTGSDKPLLEILSAMEELDAPVIYSVHPRNQKRAEALRDAGGFKNTLLAQPVGYLTSLYLVKNAKKIITDSGGLQREAWFFGKQCIVLFDAGWPSIMVGNICQTCRTDKEEILKKLAVNPDFSKLSQCFGDGHAAEKTTEHINNLKKA